VTALARVWDGYVLPNLLQMFYLYYKTAFPCFPVCNPKSPSVLHVLG